MFLVGGDFGNNSIDRNRQSIRVEKVCGMGVEHGDTAYGVIEGNRVFLPNLQGSEREVVEFPHLGGHLVGSGGRAVDIGLGNNQAGFR